MFQKGSKNGWRTLFAIILMGGSGVAFGGAAEVSLSTNDLTSISMGFRGESGSGISRMAYDFTPLQFAAYYNLADIVDLLLRGGDDVNAKGRIGKTPLHIAIEREHTAVAYLLVTYGANVGIRDCNGRTPMELERMSSASTAKDLVAINSPAK